MMIMVNICEKCIHKIVCRYQNPQEPCEECNQYTEELVPCEMCRYSEKTLDPFTKTDSIYCPVVRMFVRGTHYCGYGDSK